MDTKEQIKRRVSIVEVAGIYADLKPAGKYYKALCPLHTEKTPSFYVYPEKENFACYGCNKFGDIFTLTQEMENLTFVEAMNFLIDKFHIQVEKTGGKKTSSTAAFAGINEIAMKHFRENLFDSPEGKKASEYLRQRGITPEVIDLFSLGYAENRWDGLCNYLQRKNVNVPAAKAEELGLLIRNQQRNSLYDRFRGRVMFPIFSESGALIAFGGRTIFDEPAKYLNSPDTPVYKKGYHLYGFSQAKNAIRESKKVILVEGYFDVVSLYQNGVQNAVASLGTALTENQVNLLKRFAETMYICYDSDKAGVEASMRAIEKMFEQNINPRVVSVPGAKDPDDFIRQQGLKAFNEVLESSRDAIKFLIDHEAGKVDMKAPEQMSRAAERTIGYIEKFHDQIVRDKYIEIAADYFKVQEKQLANLRKGGHAPKGSGAPQPVGQLVITPAERMFLQAILAMPVLIEGLDHAVMEKLAGIMASRNLIILLLQHYSPRTAHIENLPALNRKLTPPEQAELRAIYDSAGDLEQDRRILEQKVRNAVGTFGDMWIEHEFRRVEQRIKIAERENNTQEVLRLLGKKIEYKRNIDQKRREKKEKEKKVS